MPMRLASSVTTYDCSKNCLRTDSEKFSHWGPCVTRIVPRVDSSSFHAAERSAEVPQIKSPPIGRTSPLHNALPAHPPSPLSRCVERLPRTFGTSSPPQTQR